MVLLPCSALPHVIHRWTRCRMRKRCNKKKICLKISVHFSFTLFMASESFMLLTWDDNHTKSYEMVKRWFFAWYTPEINVCSTLFSSLSPPKKNRRQERRQVTRSKTMTTEWKHDTKYEWTHLNDTGLVEWCIITRYVMSRFRIIMEMWKKDIMCRRMVGFSDSLTEQINWNGLKNFQQFDINYWCNCSILKGFHCNFLKYSSFHRFYPNTASAYQFHPNSSLMKMFYLSAAFKIISIRPQTSHPCGSRN